MPWKLCLLPLFAPQWSVVKPVLKLCDVLYGSVVPFVLSCLLIPQIDEMLFFHCACLCVRACMYVRALVSTLMRMFKWNGEMQLGFNDYLKRRGIYQSLPKYLDSWHQALLVNYDKTKLDSNILICCSRENQGKTKNIKRLNSIKFCTHLWSAFVRLEVSHHWC